MRGKHHPIKINQEWETFIDCETGKVVTLLIRRSGKGNHEQSGKRVSNARNNKYVPTELCTLSDRTLRNVL